MRTFEQPRSLHPGPVMHSRGRIAVVVVGACLLAAGLGSLIGAAVAGFSYWQAERIAAAGEVVPGQVTQSGAVAYADPTGQVRLARLDTGAAPGTVVQVFIDPANPARVRPLETTVPTALAPALAGAGVVAAAAGGGLLRRPRRCPDGPAPLSRWEAINALLLAFPQRPATLARQQGRPVDEVARELLTDRGWPSAVGPWLPREVDSQPPAGSTGPHGLWWTAAMWVGVIAAAFLERLSLAGGPGREPVVALAAVFLGLPCLVVALGVRRHRLRVDPDGRLTVPGLLRRRQFDLSQLVRVTGWAWKVRPQPGSGTRYQLDCVRLGAHFRDGRYLFVTPGSYHDRELLGRALRWWALHNRASVTPDLALGFGLVADPRDRAGALPVMGDDRRLRGPARRLRTGLLRGAIGFALAAALALTTLSVPAANRLLGPPPDPRLLADPCALLVEQDLAGPFTAVTDEVAWRGCASTDPDRRVWLAVNPAQAAGTELLRSWAEEGAGMASIEYPELLSAMGVRSAQLVLADGGTRVGIVFLTEHSAGLASVAQGARTGDGRQLADQEERFWAAMSLVAAYTQTPPGNQPVRDFWSGDLDDQLWRAVNREWRQTLTNRLAVIEFLFEVHDRAP